MESLKSSMEEPLDSMSDEEKSTYAAAESGVEPALAVDEPIRSRAKQILNRPVTDEVADMNKESAIEYKADGEHTPEMIASQMPVEEITLARAIQQNSSASILKAPIISVDDYEVEEDETLDTEQIVRANLSILKDDLEVGAGESAGLKTNKVTSLSMARQNVLGENIINEDIAGEVDLGNRGVIAQTGHDAGRHQHTGGGDSGLTSCDEHEQTALSLLVSTDLEDDTGENLKRHKTASFACPRQIVEPPSEDASCQQLESLAADKSNTMTIERVSTQQVSARSTF